MSDPYDGMAKVVKKINDYKFAINRGSQHGVKVGDNYLVFRLGENISDPDTGEDLGVLEIVIGRAKVTHTQDRLATLESSETKKIAGTTRRIKREGGIGLIAMMNAPTVEEIEEGAETYQSEIEVKPGDIARQV